MANEEWIMDNPKTAAEIGGCVDEGETRTGSGVAGIAGFIE
jgi:hypothetical protein